MIWLYYLCAGWLGLCMGSFANVIIHRLPLVLLQDEDPDARQQGDDLSVALHTISAPRSYCPSCATPLRWYHNIPIISWFSLRRKCAFCAQPISARYPVVEALGLAVGLAIAYLAQAHWVIALACGGFVWTLMILAVIDQRTGFLLDVLTIPLLWAGMLFNHSEYGLMSLSQSLNGAVWGYCGMRLVAICYRLVRRRDGMGGGDLKMVAAIGAWLGASMLPLVVLLAASIGILQALAYRLASRGAPAPEPEASGEVVHFGPALAAAAAVGMLLVLLYGPYAAYSIVAPLRDIFASQ